MIMIMTVVCKVRRGALRRQVQVDGAVRRRLPPPPPLVSLRRQRMRALQRQRVRALQRQCPSPPRRQLRGRPRRADVGRRGAVFFDTACRARRAQRVVGAGGATRPRRRCVRRALPASPLLLVGARRATAFGVPVLLARCTARNVLVRAPPLGRRPLARHASRRCRRRYRRRSLGRRAERSARARRLWPVYGIYSRALTRSLDAARVARAAATHDSLSLSLSISIDLSRSGCGCVTTTRSRRPKASSVAARVRGQRSWTPRRCRRAMRTVHTAAPTRLVANGGSAMGQKSTRRLPPAMCACTHARCIIHRQAQASAAAAAA